MRAEHGAHIALVGTTGSPCPCSTLSLPSPRLPLPPSLLRGRWERLSEQVAQQLRALKKAETDLVKIQEETEKSRVRRRNGGP